MVILCYFLSLTRLFLMLLVEIIGQATQLAYSAENALKQLAWYGLVSLVNRRYIVIYVSFLSSINNL